MNAKEYFEKLRASTLTSISELKSKLLKNSLLRLAVFLFAASAVYYYWNNTTVVFLIILIIVAMFVGLVRYHADLKSTLKFEQALLDNCDEELCILAGKWRDRAEGKEFLNVDHAYAKDLNIFGKHGVFQYLNRTKTEFAKTRLAAWLKTPLIKKSDINREKEIIGDLAKHPDFLMRLMAYAKFSNVDAAFFDSVKTWANESEFNRSKVFWFVVLYIAPAFAITATVLYIVDVLSFNSYLLSLVLPGALVGIKLAEHQKRFGLLIRMFANAQQFEAMLALLEAQNFESPAVNKLLENTNLNESTEGLRALQKIVGGIESRNNVIVSIALNLLLLWDFQCAHRLNKWKKQYAHQLFDWLHLANTFETYASLAIFVFEHPEYTYPEFTDAGDFELKDARHILMDKNAVANSLSITDAQRFYIITGANMAGKSTYLRTIGTSLVLAMRGLPIHATYARFKPTQLFTSMLSADSLGDNESYFFNELKRLRQMTDKLEAGESLFVILDEILKGTNSIDKAEGSRRFMEKLLTLPAKGLIATHDLSLCKLSEVHPSEIKNKKFEVRFADDELVFDYKLESGVCQNMNASFLLKKMGLTE